jgi:hypothetical protein
LVALILGITISRKQHGTEMTSTYKYKAVARDGRGQGVNRVICFFPKTYNAIVFTCHMQRLHA